MITTIVNWAAAIVCIFMAVCACTMSVSVVVFAIAEISRIIKERKK
jgi:hypothetical protein